VQKIIALDGHNEGELLGRAAAIESHSVHPLARAIIERAKADDAPRAEAEDYRAHKGKGAESRVDGKDFWIGSHRFAHERGVEDEKFHKMAVELEDAGHSLVVMGTDDHICGAFSVADQVRDRAAAAVRAIKARGLTEVTMLTGDNQRTAEATAEAVGVDDIRAELLPEDKVRAVEELVRKHGAVAMVGDGVNDAPAMAAATVGIAMGAIGTDAAIETADIALMSDDLERVPWLIGHARRTLAVIKQNIAFALGVKAVFIILAGLGLATLWAAIAADMGASLVVIFNSLRLLNSKSADI
jgi:Cd2+/Zn2+-exporting ATPase